MGDAGDAALGFLTKGMYYRESVEISFKAKGLTPRYVFESDSTFQIIRAVQAGICCAIMPLNNGLEALSDNLEILPIAETHVDSQLALIMRQQEPVSTRRKNASPRRRGYLAEAGPPTRRLVTKMPKRPLMGECQYSPGDAGPLVKSGIAAPLFMPVQKLQALMTIFIPGESRSTHHKY